MRSPSPFRYPGGKVSLTNVIQSVIYANHLQGGVYVEPFAGGAGAGLKLLVAGHVDRLIINDADRAVFSFWNSVMRRSRELISLIEKTPLTIPEWRRQRAIYRSPGRCTQLELGFAAFYLNRCNRSGIIKNGGPIGGIAQSGTWKMDARFNRNALAQRVHEISAYGDRIKVLRKDALELLQTLPQYTNHTHSVIYIDPPYYVKGAELYLNHYSVSDHVALAGYLRESKINWLLTYDDHPEIRSLYDTHDILDFRLRYSAHHDSTEGGEVLITPSHVELPTEAKQLLRTRARNFAPKAA